MSKKTTRAIISALITLVIFVGIPFIAPSYLSPETMAMAADYGFDLLSLFNKMMMIGAVTAALTMVKGFVDETNIISLLVTIVQNLSSLIFIFVLLGAGNIMSMGLTEFTIEQVGVTSITKMDLRVFIYFTFGTIGLKVIQFYLEWIEARRDAAPPGRIPS